MNILAINYYFVKKNSSYIIFKSDHLPKALLLKENSLVQKWPRPSLSLNLDLMGKFFHADTYIKKPHVPECPQRNDSSWQLTCWSTRWWWRHGRERTDTFRLVLQCPCFSPCLQTRVLVHRTLKGRSSFRQLFDFKCHICPA